MPTRQLEAGVMPGCGHRLAECSCWDRLIAILRANGFTYEKIGKRLGMTRQRVRQIEGDK